MRTLKIILIITVFLFFITGCLVNKYAQPWINAKKDGYFYKNDMYIKYYYDNKNFADSKSNLRKSILKNDALLYNKSLEMIVDKYMEE
jgi:hypothetical protein